MFLSAPSDGVVVIGGGPAGLMAAEVISRAGYPVAVYDAMPSVGRKFLLAGVGGMNITHAEAADSFVTRYGDRQTEMTALLESFSAATLRAWIHELGIETFVGSSGRVFPREMKAAPLLRAWLHRLRAAGVKFHTRHRWQGWSETGELRFLVDQGEGVVSESRVPAQALVLALGGASWSRLGSDGAWVPLLGARGVEIAELQPANCGFSVAWSEHIKTQCAGEPLKNLAFSLTDHRGGQHHQRGEAVLTERGIEGGAIYALSAALRETLKCCGRAQLLLDLVPDQTPQAVALALAKPRGKNSLSNHLRKTLKLSRVKLALLRECLPAQTLLDPEQLAGAIKALPLNVLAPHPIDEAISSAGGVSFGGLDQRLMLTQLPGVFCAGEMLDWEAPTGGYLLTACFASGRVAGQGVLDWLAQESATDKD